MGENLVIVESPAKAKTIEKFLGKDYQVVSSFGHIRDLSKKKLGIDIENNYTPEYIISEDKKKVVSELKKQVKKATAVWLASDEDREGEAIAWHLAEVLKLKPENTQRIVFHEITKDAIQKAIQSPRKIDHNLVMAQQARRILDRLVGFELSPVLWRKVKPNLSAGRVQSVAVRLLVEREREIMNFKPTSSYRVVGVFEFESEDGKKEQIKAVLQSKPKTKKEAEEFLALCKKAQFTIEDVVKKPSKRTPAAPFTTSTLQQEASRKLGFSVNQTMTVAQRLYESGKITYMRTDSVNLSQTALDGAKKTITQDFGADYLKIRSYKTKTKGAQEAHEAIRPTNIEKATVSGNASEQKLYELIWKRTIASQMSDAEIEKTTIKIGLSNDNKKFTATGEVIKFDGFLKVYFESTDEEPEEKPEGLLPNVKEKQPVSYKSITATEKYAYHPPRYTEASLVKKLEELGIGRPSTYAPTISTIQQRGYVVKEDREGHERKYNQLVLEGDKLKAEVKVEIANSEKSKLFPRDIGMVVNDFLMEHFDQILDYNFTATVEKEFDDIAEGKIDWTKMLDKFYSSFHPQVEETLETSQRSKGERLLGNDPETGKPVYVKIGRYGPVAQIGEANPEDENAEKPKFASLQKNQLIETITLEEALELFKLPRNLGKYEDKDVIIGIGRFGPYVRHNNAFTSLKKGVDDPYKITLERAIELIEEKREKDRNKIIKQFDEEPDLQVLNGRWGPYISYKKKNYKIPKKMDSSKLTLEDCKKIIEEGDNKKKK
ncbi:MAG: type I DNA topoisomerase [Bacteroidota bacterium]